MNTVPETDFSLRGKRIVVLGGSSGIGLATALAAAAEGAQIVIVSGNRSRIDVALQSLPADTLGVAADLGREDAIRRLFEQLGNFDHLVYTAGEHLQLGLLKDTELDRARDFLNVRLWGAVAALKYGAPLINKGGSICLTSGIVSQRPAASWWLGASVCSAMEGFCRAMAIELAPIRVNIVAPGVVQTNLWQDRSEAERTAFYTAVGNSLPVGRVGTAEELAQAYLFLMKQPFMTGERLTIDGGGVLS